jgi:hypothetical protein
VQSHGKTARMDLVYLLRNILKILIIFSTISSIELREALRHKYRVTRCYRIWKYNRFENLFKDYVQAFMKMKIESSDFPSDIQTGEQKTQWAMGIF